MQLCGSRAPGTAVQARAARVSRRSMVVRCEAGATVKPAVDTIELGKSGECEQQRQPTHAFIQSADEPQAALSSY
jgi:hypothetical protein